MVDVVNDALYFITQFCMLMIPQHHFERYHIFANLFVILLL